MYIELIDLLRCPRPHEDSWLVAAFEEMEHRFVVRGSLGCPVCGNRYSIVNGVANLTVASVNSVERGEARLSTPDGELPIRVAAMLGLGAPGALVILGGEACMLARPLSELVSARVIAVNPPAAMQESDMVAIIRCDERVALAPRSADGMMLDQGTLIVLGADPGPLKTGGRLVIPASGTLPADCRELARDELDVVAERSGELVSLSR
ncbi:MAG TPA: hypothetical protein VM939_01795 [Gemmatimonadaceae bacterium]|nr:hypothetical protein [Gemmatimonadaceae bacterium]